MEHDFQLEALEEAASLPSTIYRYFDKYEFAEQFSKGKIKIGTLSEYRKIEDDVRGDPKEGFRSRLIQNMRGDHSNENFRQAALEVGIRPGRNTTIINCSGIHVLEDAYVLCTTESSPKPYLLESFGQYCVKISSPSEFFCALTVSLGDKIQRTDVFGWLSRVKYIGRDFLDTENLNLHPAFIKPEHPYSSQQEVRFSWTPSFFPIESFILDCEPASKFCELLDLSTIDSPRNP